MILRKAICFTTLAQKSHQNNRYIDLNKETGVVYEFTHVAFYCSPSAVLKPRVVDVSECCYLKLQCQDYEQERNYIVTALVYCDELGSMTGNLNTTMTIQQNPLSRLSMIATHYEVIATTS